MPIKVLQETISNIALSLKYIYINIATIGGNKLQPSTNEICYKEAWQTALSVYIPEQLIDKCVNLYVRLNFDISAIIAANDSKFGRQVPLYSM